MHGISNYSFLLRTMSMISPVSLDTGWQRIAGVRASYPMIARDLCRRSSPETFQNIKLADNRNYTEFLMQISI